MNEVTQLLNALGPADPHAASRLLLVHDGLRRLAAQRLARELPGQSVQPIPRFVKRISG